MPISKREIARYVDIRDWINQELRLRISEKAFEMPMVQANARQRKIVSDELPNNWKELNYLYGLAMGEKKNPDDSLRQKAGHLAMLGVTLAQKSFILHRAGSGVSLGMAAKASFGHMDRYVDQLRSGDRNRVLPVSASLRNSSIRDAMAEYTGRSAYSDPTELLTAMAGFAIRATDDLFKGRDAVLPVPGSSIGDPEQWWQPRLEQDALQRAQQQIAQQPEY